MINLDETILHTFLRERRNKINNGRKFPVESLLSNITFLFSLLTANYSSIKILHSVIVTSIFWSIYFLYTIYVVIKVYRFVKNDYSIEELYEEIKSLENKERAYSLIAIRNREEFGDKRFLLVYNQLWKCYLLPFVPTSEQNNEEKIKQYVKDMFHVSEKDFSIFFVKETKETKFSFSNQRTQIYNHSYYDVVINIGKKLRKRTFRINHKKYKWFSFDEMKKNRSIMKKNKGVVNNLFEMYR